jgi:hypothetical protein
VAERLKHLESLVLSLAQEVGEGAATGNVRLSAPSSDTSSGASSDARPFGLQTPMGGGDDSLLVAGTACSTGVVNTATVYGHATPSPSPSSVAHVSGGPSQIRSHIESSHWSSVLEDIRQIRDQLSPSSSGHDAQEHAWNSFGSPSESVLPSRENRPGAGEDLVFGAMPRLDMRQILGSLPSRQVCDSLVSRYFLASHQILRTYCTLCQPFHSPSRGS